MARGLEMLESRTLGNPSAVMKSSIRIAAYVYPEGLRTLTGVSMLTLNMVRQLSECPGVDLRLLAPADELDRQGRIPGELNLNGIPVISLPWRRSLREGLWLTMNAPTIDRYLPADCWVYCTRETFIPARHCKRIVTVHHLEPVLDTVALSRRRVTQFGQNLRLRKALTTADLVVAQSTFTKTEVTQRFPVPSSRIEVVGSGVSNKLLAQGASDWRPEVTNLEPYVISAGAFHPRKGTDYLFAMARELARRDSLLRIVCPYGSEGVPSLVREAKTLSNLVVLDHVSREDLVILIRNAVCMVIPSRLEGFGLTAVESMALATPVVASDNSALPETLGGAGILVDPSNAVALADAVERVFRNPEQGHSMVSAGLKRAEYFTWQKCGERLLAAIRATTPRRQE